jgi:hypothetical protein
MDNKSEFQLSFRIIGILEEKMDDEFNPNFPPMHLCFSIYYFIKNHVIEKYMYIKWNIAIITINTNHYSSSLLIIQCI